MQSQEELAPASSNKPGDEILIYPVYGGKSSGGAWPIPWLHSDTSG